jgi:hypothetical protein
MPRPEILFTVPSFLTRRGRKEGQIAVALWIAVIWGFDI